MAAKLLILAVLVHASFAFFFTRPIPVAQAEGREVEQSCLALAESGSCDFYACFEQRLPCGWNYYIMRQGFHYCNRLQNRRHLFSPEGQQFIDNALQCMMEPLQEIYSRDSMDCHDLEHAAVDAIAPCFDQHNFCDVLQTDLQEFLGVYEYSDLLSRGATKIWRALAQIAGNCGVQLAREFSSEVHNTLEDSLDGLFNSIITNILQTDEDSSAYHSNHDSTSAWDVTDSLPEATQLANGYS